MSSVFGDEVCQDLLTIDRPLDELDGFEIRIAVHDARFAAFDSDDAQIHEVPVVVGPPVRHLLTIR